MFLSVLATICAFYTIEAAVCVATYRYLKEEQRNEEILREKYQGLTEKLTNLNNTINNAEDYRTAQQKLCEEVEDEIVKALNSEKLGLIFTDENEEIIKVGPDDYLTKIHRRYLDE
ncbi:MAG: hypothetical protein J5617_03840 [Bacilli bacterium]|nr:hypothetical protein [Bacilli bacterium]